jgi:cobalt/nickel transport system permease protein
MHLADGFLTPGVCLITGALSLGAVGLSLRKLEQSCSARTVPLTGMMAALIFAGQMVNFPIGLPVSGHLLGGVLAAVIVGPWAGCLAMALVLLVQMVLFADGGWLAYGANLLNMGVVGSLGGYAIYAQLRQWIGGSRGILIGAVAAAWLSVVAGSTMFCIEFACSHPNGDYDLGRIFGLMTIFHSVIGIGEALITGSIVSYVLAVRPDLFPATDSLERPATVPSLAGTARFVWAGVIVALAIAAFAAPFASEYADGLEAVAERMNFGQLAGESRPLVLGDYSLPLPGVNMSSGFWQKLSVSLAGLMGTLSVLAMALIFGRVFKPRLSSPEPPHGI